MNESRTAVESSAMAFLRALSGNGIRHVFANAGTDFAPVIEALVTAAREGVQVPQFHTVPHENVAMAMAHGYYAVCGEPAAVMVHVTVGTANALCGVMNAARDNVPVLLVAGKTPNTEFGHPGSRNANIHWGQDSFDQGGMVREYVKWDYELRGGQPVESILRRALDIALDDPPGPVYLIAPREVLGDDAVAPTVPLRGRPGVVAAMPDAGAVGVVADAIAGAELPLLITAAAGRDPENVTRLAALGERHAIGLAYPGEPGARMMCFPSDHPMFVGVNPRDAIEAADVIVVLESEVPWWPRYTRPRPDARIFHVAPDPLFSRFPVRGFTGDLFVRGSSAGFLTMLGVMLDAREGAGTASRRTRIAAMASARRERLQQVVQASANRNPIHPAWVAECINRVKQPDTIIVNELGVPLDLLQLSRPRTYLTTSAAAGLGFGLGASLGARLAAPDQQVILVVGDGSYMFGNPVATHHVAAAEGLPTLTVIMNNRRWHAVHRSTLGMYPDGEAATATIMPLVDLGPPPDYRLFMQAYGGYGERVTDAAQLESALRRGLEANSRGTPALLDVLIEPNPA